MRFPSLRTERNKSANITTDWVPTELQHPDLPLDLQHPPTSSSSSNPLTRSATVSNRINASDRRSIAGLGVNGIEYNSAGASNIYSPDDFQRPSPGLQRSFTVSRTSSSAAPLPSPSWSSDFSQLPNPPKQHETGREFVSADQVPMSAAYPSNTPAGKTSSDSGQGTALDRWSQRRLQRLNTEQGFREQRQGGAGVSSPHLSDAASYHSYSAPAPYSSPPEAKSHAAQPPGYQPAQPQPPASQPSYQGSRPALAPQTNSYTPSQSYSPPEDTSSQYRAQDGSRPHTTTQRSQSYSQQGGVDPSSMSSNNGNGTKAVRPGNNHRQSVHSSLGPRESSAMGTSQAQQGVPAFNAAAVTSPTPPQTYPPGQSQPQAQSQQQSAKDVGRVTPQPAQVAEELSEEDVNQLIKDHKELREKYTKVKKYYFEKEDQVKQLQNSLAHQRLSQSRTSLDDSEYTTRFNRLDGLVAQLAFSIRKSWRSVPAWLNGSVNKDAVATGKQEMTAIGRAFISSWLVEEIFNKVFHPDLDPALSGQLRSVQTNIRKYAPHAQTLEEEEYLISKVVNWRLATLEGLQDSLRSPQCPQYRSQLTDLMKDRLVRALAVHLQDPPPSDLEGGVHMIIELVVNVAAHLPLESRDVSLEYFIPGMSIMPEQMRLESGIPALQASIADDQAERASMKSSASDANDMTDASASTHSEHKSKRSMLSALTGTNKPKSSAAQQGKHSAANGSSNSLAPRPESASGVKEDSSAPPRVRIAAGIMVQIRGRSVLVKAPVFST